MTEAIIGLPRVAGFVAWLCKGWLQLMGWQVEGEIPHIPKIILVFAPHTSNWDFFLMLPAVYVAGVSLRFLGKKELFWWPLGAFMRALGGIPVYRNSRSNTVDQIVDLIQSSDRIALGIAPEGTRSNTPYWKSGFYHMALRAGVPMQLAYLDYARKRAGFGPLVEATGDIQADMGVIRDFYRTITAKYPHKVGEIAIRSQEV